MAISVSMSVRPAKKKKKKNTLICVYHWLQFSCNTFNLSSAVCGYLTCFGHVLRGHSNPREEGVTLLNLLPECQSGPLLVSSTPFNLLKKIIKSCQHTFAGL